MTINNVRIIARIRPLLTGESEKEVVVSAEEDAISMPNPKNENEYFTFPFNAVYGQDSDQAQLFSEGEFVVVAAVFIWSVNRW